MSSPAATRRAALMLALLAIVGRAGRHCCPRARRRQPVRPRRWSRRRPLRAAQTAAAQTVALSRILHGSHTIDLRGSRRFAAHGFAGTVTSTLVLALAHPRRLSNSGGSSPPTSPSKPKRRDTRVRYRVVHVGGSAVSTVRASAVAAVCDPFDACGLQGTINVGPWPTSSGFAFIDANAPLSRPKRGLLDALGLTSDGNPSGIGVEGVGIATVRGTLSADLTQQNDACRDQVACASSWCCCTGMRIGS
jgi:hypothetical protein